MLSSFIFFSSYISYLPAQSDCLNCPFRMIYATNTLNLQQMIAAVFFLVGCFYRSLYILCNSLHPSCLYNFKHKLVSSVSHNKAVFGTTSFNIPAIFAIKASPISCPRLSFTDLSIYVQKNYKCVAFSSFIFCNIVSAQ